MAKTLEGTVDRHERGFGFFIHEDDESKDDLFIPPGRLGGAMSGDRVRVELHPSQKKGKNEEARVVEVLERRTDRFIGRVQIDEDDNKTVVLPVSVGLSRSVRIPHQANNPEVKDNYLVEVEIEEYEPLRGVLVDVLGEAGDPEVERELILRKYELDSDFPGDVRQEARNLPDRVRPDEMEDRLDLRDLEVLTIDPGDAKDLDDAVSISRTRSGNHKVGVHITDVSHYIEPDSALDREARERGTSVYLANEVVPMFPVEFSNGIGSLDDEGPRLALTVFMIINDNLEVVDTEFHQSVIQVDHCLSYDQVDAYLEGEGTSDAVEDVQGSIDRMVELSQALRKQRLDRGSLDFDLPEVRLKFQDGEVDEVIPVEHTVSHQAIEEFMIAANEAVAEYLTANDLPVLYRIHEPPETDDVKSLARFLEGLGYDLQVSEEDELHPRQFQEILHASRDRPEEQVVAWNLLRSLQKARYSPENVGHFGLASNCYAHFTSPIRRYPDLMVHRILKRKLTRDRVPQEEQNALRGELPELATHLSDREQNATDAERESVNVNLLHFMQDQVGEELVGYVSATLEFGCFVQLPNTLEGLIHVANMDDYYVYNEEDQTLTGKDSGTVLQIGDRVKVRVAKVDIPRRELDFELLEILGSSLRDTDGENAGEES